MEPTAPPAPRPASTVIVCRPCTATTAGAAAFELLLVKRHGKSGFMAGAHVFPGGRVDEADQLGDAARAEAAHALLDGAVEKSAALGFLQAAVRETREEANVDVDASAFFPWAWWITPAEEPKRFDTRFFLCAVPAGTVAVVDDHEAVAFAWLTPKDALQAYGKGEIALAPPTLATLEDLAAFTSVADAARAVARPLRAICPRIVSTDDGLVLALPGDPLHDVREPAFTHRSRFIMNESGRFASALVSRAVPAKEDR